MGLLVLWHIVRSVVQLPGLGSCGTVWVYLGFCGQLHGSRGRAPKGRVATRKGGLVLWSAMQWSGRQWREIYVR